LSLNRPRIKKN